MDGLNEYLNKKVVIQKNDGAKKYGILKGYDSAFLQLQFVDGSIVTIPLVSVASIELAR